MTNDRGALIADEITDNFSEHRSKFGEVFGSIQENTENYIDGSAICRSASFVMHTRDIGTIEFDIVYSPEGSVHMRTQLSDQVRCLDDTMDNPKTLVDGIKCYIDENIAFTDGKDINFTEVEYQDVVADFTLQRRPDGQGYETIICSVTPVGGASAPAP